ncbi:hypothetical protein P3T73_11000 [Kiritimatiellota bacterium B12222]|nr:hypothetical protein P3T73_11000 [Kiritimatiellota bacterium B12222]
MKQRKILLWLCVVFWSLTSFAGEACEVWLLNGDRIIGEYLGQEGSFALIQLPWQEEQIRVHGKYIHSIDFKAKSRILSGEWMFEFNGNERINGRLIEAEAERLVLKTQWAQSLELMPEFIKKITPAIPQNLVLYDGPGNPKTWRFKSQNLDPFGSSVTLDGGTVSESIEGWLVQNQIAMMTNLPRMHGSFGMQFRFSFHDNALGSTFALSLEDLPTVDLVDTRKTETLLFRIEQGMVSFVRGGRNLRFMRGGLQSETQVPLKRGEDLLLELLFDAQHNLYHAKVDGRVVESWGNASLPPNTDTFVPELMIESAAGNPKLLVKEILLYRFEGTLANDTNALPEEGELLLFKNGDVLKGEWQGIDDDDQWLFQMTGMNEPLAVEGDRVWGWQNDDRNKPEIRIRSSHVHVLLNGRSESFIAELIGSEPTGLRFKREGWVEDFLIPYSQLEQVKFNPRIEKRF